MRICLLFVAGALAAQQLDVPKGVVLQRDIEYARIPDGALAMDVARPEGAGPFPAVVVIHGGGFKAGTRQGNLPTIVWLAQRGYTAATISYRLTPKYQYPANVHDAKSAVRFLRANADRFRVDKQRIGAVGYSAGGYIAAMLGLTRGVASMEGPGANLGESSSVDCAVSYYSRSDLSRAYAHSANGPEIVPLLLGGEFEVAERIHRQASPLNWVTPASAPVLSIHGTLDQNVGHEHSMWLTERLMLAGVDSHVEIIEGARHGFKGAEAERADARMIAWLDKYLKPVKDKRRLLLSGAGEEVEIGWPSGAVIRRRKAETAASAPAMVGGAKFERWRFAKLSAVIDLPGGGVLLADEHARRLLELDKSGKLVHELREVAHPMARVALANGQD